LPGKKAKDVRKRFFFFSIFPQTSFLLRRFPRGTQEESALIAALLPFWYYALLTHPKLPAAFFCVFCVPCFSPISKTHNPSPHPLLSTGRQARDFRRRPRSGTAHFSLELLHTQTSPASSSKPPTPLYHREMRLVKTPILASVPALLLLLLLGGQQQGVQAIPGGGLLWSSLNTTAVHGKLVGREGGRREGG